MSLGLEEKPARVSLYVKLIVRRRKPQREELD
jgi:hypothetical protein